MTQETLVRISTLAVQITEELMSQKTGEELEAIFQLGKESFEKAKAAGMLAGALLERILLKNASDDQVRALGVSPDIESPLQAVVTQMYVQYWQKEE